MDLTPLRSAALGLLAVAGATLAISQSVRLAAYLTRRLGLRAGLRDRCRSYTLAMLLAALALVMLSGIVQ